MIPYIANDELGSSVRSKLNEVIDIVNQEETGTLPNLSVGPTGDYPTINQALNRLTRMDTVTNVSGGVLRATITLQSNYVMNEQVLVNGLNLGWIRKQSTGTVTINRSALTTDLTNLDYGFNSYPAFGVINGGTLPVISGSFTMNTSGSASNQSIITVTGAGSSANVDTGSSLTNATGHNVAVGYGATFQARDSSITGSLNRNNVNVNNASTASFNKCVLQEQAMDPVSKQPEIAE